MRQGHAIKRINKKWSMSGAEGKNRHELNPIICFPLCFFHLDTEEWVPAKLIGKQKSGFSISHFSNTP